MANTATVAREIQVGAGRPFEPHRWRDAFLRFLNGIWSDNPEVADQPQIWLGNDPAADGEPGVVLRLLGNEYCAYGTAAVSDDRAATGLYSHEMLFASPAQYHVEAALIRFVRSDTIRAIRIDAANGGHVWLWKGARRSELCVAASGISLKPKAGETP